mgnify:CR=1 FL=1
MTRIARSYLGEVELTPMGAKGKPPRSMSSVRTAQIFAPLPAQEEWKPL